jgi:hypothetical protein
MRNIWLILLGASCLAFSGCEDGPDQIYGKAPNGAGDRWNDGKTPGTWDDGAKNGFGDSFGGTSRQELCSGAEKQKRWSQMVNEPLVPPRMLGGLDVAGGDLWPGLLFEDAERKLCQSDAMGTDGEGSLYASWGDAAELQVGYNLSNHKINFVQINQGYKGTVDFKSRPGSRFGAHTYQIGVGIPVKRDGKNFDIEWLVPTRLDEQATELYDAMMYSFSPDLPGDDVNCRASAACRAQSDGMGGGGFGARNLGMYLHVPSVSKPQPVPSTPDFLYLWPVKVLPFSNAEMFLKLDEEGPTASATGLGDRTPKATCTMKLGVEYGRFLEDCVTVLQDPQQNQQAKNKLLGNLQHTSENFIFDVVGVNLDFTAEAIGAFDVVHDDWVPQAHDTATEFLVDIRANGKMLNEYSKDGKTFTFAGTAAIYREYARLVQKDLHARMADMPNLKDLPKFELGDPKCLLPNPLPEGFDIEHWHHEAGCTGMEQFITPANPDTGNANLDRVSVGPKVAQALRFTTVLKPGDPVAVFCADPGTFDHCGGATDHAGFSSSLWDGTYRRVLDYLGDGDPFKLPPEARDRKYYFKLWAHAYIKYLKAASLYPTDLSKADYDAYEPEPDHLIFDDLGAENEKFEYIDRRFVTHDREPLKYEYQALIVAGNQRESKFHRRMTRAERTLYRAMEKDKSSAPGGPEDNIRISNLVGSVVLKNNWFDSGKEGKDAYFCATNEDDDCKAAGGALNSPPKAKGKMMLDDYGKPLLTNYQGAFTGTVFTLGTEHLRIVETLPMIRSAKVEVPSHQDPYALAKATVAASPRILTLADWRPKSPDNGVRIPRNGQRDRFIPSASVDFTGTSISLNLDYEPDANGMMKLTAVQSNDYMGDLFLCRDPVSGDLLRVEQYESMAEVIEWIQGHPGSYEACGIIIRYSPYNNYPHMLASTKAGIVLLVNQGSGYGRISSVEIYDPNL